MNDVNNKKTSAQDFRLSASGLSTLKNCPKRFGDKYYEGIPEGPSGWESYLGTEVHEVLEHLFALPGKDRTQDAARDEIVRRWPTFMDLLNTDIPDDIPSEGELKSVAWAAIEGLWQIEDPTKVNVHSVEMQLDANFNGNDFIGFVDRIDETPDGLVIVDYKTGKLGKKPYFHQKLIQLMLYAWALKEKGIDAHSMRLYYTREHAIIQMEITDFVIESAEKYLESSVESIEDGMMWGFHPNPSPLCGWCPYVATCGPGRDFFWRMANKGSMRADAPAFSILLEAQDEQDQSPLTQLPLEW